MNRESSLRMAARHVRAANHARRNEEAAQREKEWQALSPAERTRRLEADRARRRQEHADRNAAAARQEELDRRGRQAMTDQRMRRGPQEDKMLRGPAEDKSGVVVRKPVASAVRFASAAAEEMANMAGLLPEHFQGRAPAGRRGFSVAEVRQLLEDRLSEEPAPLAELVEDEEQEIDEDQGS